MVFFEIGNAGQNLLFKTEMPLYFNYDVIINQAGNELNQKSAFNLL